MNPSSNIVILPLFHRLPLTTAGVALSKRTLDLDVARFRDMLPRCSAIVDAVVEGREGLSDADLIEPVDLQNFTREVSLFGLVARAQVRAQTLADGTQHSISELWDKAFDYAFGERQFIEYRLTFDGADGARHYGTSTFCLSQDDLVPVEDVVRQVTQARQTEEGTYMFQTQDVNLLAQEVARALEEERQNEYDMFSPDVCPCSDPGSS